MADYIELEPKRTFIRIVNGRIFTKAEPGTPGAETFTDEKGRTYTGFFLRGIRGVVKGFRIVSSEFEGKRVEKSQWHVTLRSGDEDVVLTMGYSSDYATRLINALANVPDFSKAVAILPWQMPDKHKPDRYVRGVTVLVPPFDQMHDKVAPKYSKEDIPRWKEVHLNGQTLWDKSEAMQFLEGVVDRDILPRLMSRSDQAFSEIAAESAIARDDDDSSDYPITDALRSSQGAAPDDVPF